MNRDAGPALRRAFLFAALSAAVGLLLAFLLLEVGLRFFPVSESLMAVPVDARNPVFHFEPNRRVTWSLDWNFSVVNETRVNNAGFANDNDYDPDDPRPLLAVVGDSYVEALIVPYAETLHGRLSRSLGPARRVYSFAASGAPLSQYVIWAKEARQRWGAGAVVIVVVGNDFDESLAAYKTGPGFHHYVRDESGALRLRLFDHRRGRLRELIRRSALARYLVFNLHAIERMKQLWASVPRFGAAVEAEDYVGNTSAHADERRLAESRAAVAAFLRDLVAVAGLKPGEVVFVVDGLRYPDVGGEDSYFGRMRRHFLKAAAEAGFEAIDMDGRFFPEHRGSGTRFEFPTDGHWNGTAHGLAADAVLASATVARWLQGDRDARE